MTDYELAVRLLGSKNTHLKLYERAKLALKQLHTQIPEDFFSRLQLAIHIRANASNYQKQHFPGWFDIPEELRQIRYPLGNLNVMLALFRQAEELESKLVVNSPEPTEEEINQMINRYHERVRSSITR